MPSMRYSDQVLESRHNEDQLPGACPIAISGQTHWLRKGKRVYWIVGAIAMQVRGSECKILRPHVLIERLGIPLKDLGG